VGLFIVWAELPARLSMFAFLVPAKASRSAWFFGDE
jgi:hypothetical protein